MNVQHSSLRPTATSSRRLFAVPVQLQQLVDDLDDYFKVHLVENDDWAPIFESVYPEAYWRDFAERDYAAKWNGLMVRGSDILDQVRTCVFPSDRIIFSLPERTFLFSEHPMDYADEPGFTPLSRAAFQRLRESACSFYHVHAPLDMHPEVSPSRLCAEALGLTDLEEFFPIADGLSGGAAVIGDTEATVDELRIRLQAYLGDEIPVQIVAEPHRRAARVGVVAGGGAQADVLSEAIRRGADTYVTGNAVTKCQLDFVQAEVHSFHEVAGEHHVALIDATHYGTEKPPQLAMVDWFRAYGIQAQFVPDGPK